MNDQPLQIQPEAGSINDLKLQIKDLRIQLAAKEQQIHRLAEEVSQVAKKLENSERRMIEYRRLYQMYFKKFVEK